MAVAPPLSRPCSHQRSRQGDIGEGDPVPASIQLLELAPPGAAGRGAAAPRCRPVQLLELAQGPRPLALLAGSWT